MNFDTNDADLSIKIVLLGDSAVGKSSLMQNFVTDGTFHEEIGPTIGVDFKVKYITRSNKKIKLTVWDTAGQERFRTLTMSYYRGVHGVILVYDVSNRDSFDHVHEWVAELNRYAGTYPIEDVVKLLVANKIDLPGQHMVSRQEGIVMASEHGMLYMETSAKTSCGIGETFNELIDKIVEGPMSRHITSRPVTLSLSEADKYDDEKKGCCW